MMLLEEMPLNLCNYYTTMFYSASVLYSIWDSMVIVIIIVNL